MILIFSSDNKVLLLGREFATTHIFASAHTTSFTLFHRLVHILHLPRPNLRYWLP